MAIQGKPGTQSGIMDLKELVMQSAEYPQRFLSDGELSKLSKFIKEEEGTTEYQQVRGNYDPESQIFKAYQDTNDVWTIGYGNTIISGIKVKEGDTISFSEAEDLLRHTIKEKAKETNIEFINKYDKGLHDLSSDSKLLAIDMAYQLGARGFVDGYIKLVPALFEDDWVTINEHFKVHHYDKDTKMMVPTVGRNDGRKLMFIQNNLDRINYFNNKSKQFEEEGKKESLKKQKIVYDTMPDLVNAIQTQEIPKEKIKGFVTDAASGKLLSEIGERIHVPEFIENLGIDVDVKGKDEFAIKGKGITYKQKPGEQSVSGKGFTYTQTDEQKRLEKKFGKEGGVTGSIGISKSDYGNEKTIGGQINIPTDKIFRRRKRK